MRSLRALWDNTRLDLQRARRVRVGPTDLVLDVGSGGRPSPRANVLCDRFLFSGVHRSGGPLVRTRERPLVVGDITHLPFADGAFDFVICSHLLEHLDDPGPAILELQRVARAGYIETPNATNERLIGYPVHKWFVRVADGELVFEAKQTPVADPDLVAWFQKLPDRVKRAIYMRPYETDLCTCHTWRRTIPYRIEGTPFAEARQMSGSEARQSIKAGGTLARMMAAYGRWLRRRSDPRIADIARLLSCPVCRGAVAARSRGTGLVCGSCGRVYPIVDGIPRMTAEDATEGSPPSQRGSDRANGE